MTSAMQIMDVAAAVIANGRRALSMNARLEDFMPDIVCDTPSGLRLVDRQAEKLLRQAFAALERGTPTSTQSIPISPIDERPPLILHLVPIRRRARDIFVSAEAVLMLMPIVTDSEPDATVIQGLFDLTPAEVHVARGIASGKTLLEIAEERNLTRNTVRNQLSSVFQKTGCARQVDLARLLQPRLRPL